MESKLLKELAEIRDSLDPVLVYFMNNGNVIAKDSYSLNLLNNFSNERSAEWIKDLFKKAAGMYVYSGKFNRLITTIDMGLVYYKDDVDDKNHIIGHAKPINNIVYFNASKIDSYLDNKQTNKYNYCEHYLANGFVNYNEFPELMDKEGLMVSAPKTFNDFRDAVLSGEKFDITVEADLREKSYPKKLVRKY